MNRSSLTNAQASYLRLLLNHARRAGVASVWTDERIHVMSKAEASAEISRLKAATERARAAYMASLPMAD